MAAGFEDGRKMNDGVSHEARMLGTAPGKQPAKHGDLNLTTISNWILPAPDRVVPPHSSREGPQLVNILTVASESLCRGPRSSGFLTYELGANKQPLFKPFPW